MLHIDIVHVCAFSSHGCPGFDGGHTYVGIDFKGTKGPSWRMFFVFLGGREGA